MDETCAMCARVADPTVDGDPPLAWCTEAVDTRGERHTRWICPQCTRIHVRAIEAKLDHEWW